MKSRLQNPQNGKYLYRTKGQLHQAQLLSQLNNVLSRPGDTHRDFRTREAQRLFTPFKVKLDGHSLRGRLIRTFLFGQARRRTGSRWAK